MLSLSLTLFATQLWRHISLPPDTPVNYLYYHRRRRYPRLYPPLSVRATALLYEALIFQTSPCHPLLPSPSVFQRSLSLALFPPVLQAVTPYFPAILLAEESVPGL